MRILAIDTSQPNASAALAVDGRVVAARDFGAPSSHLVELGRVVDDMLKAAGVAVGDVDRVALVSGPGSFTGLRIGMAYVKGLYASVKPDIATCTGIELMAIEAVGDGEVVCPMMYARRDEVYAAVYKGAQPRGDEVAGVEAIVPPRAGSAQKFLTSLDIRPTLFVGNVAERYADLVRDRFGGSARWEERITRPSTPLLARVATYLEPLDDRRVLELEPFYIRPSDAKLSRLRAVRTHD